MDSEACQLAEDQRGELRRRDKAESEPCAELRTEKPGGCKLPGQPGAVLRESMKKQSEWKNDRKRVAMVLQKTHGGQDLTTVEYNIVMAYWKGQKSQKELFDRIFERVVG